MIQKILIANRGEIAVRVARACQELGIGAALACSSEDTDSLAARLVNERIVIGPGPGKHSYLNIPAIIEAARQVGADAIHPGYGFLSENPDIAEVCLAAGITFIGPPPDVMAKFGNKITARAVMANSSVPILPGSTAPISDAHAGMNLAVEIGFPIMIKAVAGGGGHGLQIAWSSTEFAEKYIEAKLAAQAIYGDDRIHIERYLQSARHIEIQVLCDTYGNALFLGERDCSIQRRHQKLIEEAPAPGLPAELTRSMGEAALRGLYSTGYVGAGTVEFLLDTESRYYFIEANCRIQVEHPVTEILTGIDLVAEQIRVAGGAQLAINQNDIQPRGAAIECRVNVEDPTRGFMPTPGRLARFAPPGGPFVRVDTHGYPGYRVPSIYDSLLAKVIVWAPDRQTAIARMLRALDEFDVSGPGMSTTRLFLAQVLRRDEFRKGKHYTSLVDEMLREMGG
jgi:acetyl-CoA carboxylase, biotin carboxylase subunit